MTLPSVDEKSQIQSLLTDEEGRLGSSNVSLSPARASFSRNSDSVVPSGMPSSDPRPTNRDLIPSLIFDLLVRDCSTGIRNKQPLEFDREAYRASQSYRAHVQQVEKLAPDHHALRQIGEFVSRLHHDRVGQTLDVFFANRSWLPPNSPTFISVSGPISGASIWSISAEERVTCSIWTRDRKPTLITWSTSRSSKDVAELPAPAGTGAVGKSFLRLAAACGDHTQRHNDAQDYTHNHPSSASTIAGPCPGRKLGPF